MLWASIGIYFNYTYNIQDDWVYVSNSKLSFLRQWLVFFLAYAIPMIFVVINEKKLQALKSIWLWVILITAPMVFAFTSVYDVYDALNYSSSEWNILQFYAKTSYWVTQVFVVLLFSLIIWLIKDRKNIKWYGFDFKNHQIKPYWIMLLIMLVPILLAGQTEGFQSMYPRLKSVMKPNYEALGMVEYVLYELAYGLNFLGIELFFRGFLVMALVNILGKDAILPMAVFYVSIHFSKPMGECISSFFGGCLLGIISYHTNSIKGGLLVHVGIAWLMEISGALGMM